MSDYYVLAPKARQTQDGNPGLGTEVGIGTTSHAASLHDPSFVITTLIPYFTERQCGLMGKYAQSMAQPQTTGPSYPSLLFQNFSDA